MYKRYAERSIAQTIVQILVVGMAAPLLAALNVIIGPYASLACVALAGSLAVLALPLNVVLVACLISAGLLAGMLEYFGGMNQGFWLPYFVGVVLVLRGLGDRFRLDIASPPILRQHASGSHSVQVLAFSYVSIALFGLAATQPPLPQIIVGVKNYFFIWGVLVALLSSRWAATSSKRFWTTIIVIASLQWPVALYQRLVVVARRHDAAAWDAVVGTLGGDPSGGGNSAAMAFLCCVAIAVILLRIRDKQLKIFPGYPLMILCLLPIALAEVKAAFIWLVVVFAIILGRQVVREPRRAVASLFLGAALLGSLGLTYMTTYQDQQGAGGSLQDIYDKQIKYSIDPNEFSAQYRRLGRITALKYWWQQHDLGVNPLHMLFGHGLGASRSSSSLGAGEVASRLRYSVDGTAASALLWDIGLLGTLIFTALLGSSMLGVLRLGRQARLDPLWRESAILSAVVLAMALLSLLYNKDAIDNPTVQILVLFSIAQFLIIRGRHGDGADRVVLAPAVCRKSSLKPRVFLR